LHPRYARAQMMLLGPQISNMPFKSLVIVLFMGSLFFPTRVWSSAWRLRYYILIVTMYTFFNKKLMNCSLHPISLFTQKRQVF